MAEMKVRYMFPIVGQNLSFLKKVSSNDIGLIFSLLSRAEESPVERALMDYGLTVSPDDCVRFQLNLNGKEVEAWLVWVPRLYNLNDTSPVGQPISGGEVYSQMKELALDGHGQEVFSQLFGALINAVAYGELRSGLTGRAAAV